MRRREAQVRALHRPRSSRLMRFRLLGVAPQLAPHLPCTPPPADAEDALAMVSQPLRARSVVEELMPPHRHALL